MDKKFENTLTFYVNGKCHTVTNPDPALLLVDYLRSPEVGLTGTKFGCGEGGCAACTVVETKLDPETGKIWERPINSCLRPIVTLDGTAITTTEGIGSLADGLNPVQERIAAFNGSQCGYCTPGFVMNMYSLLRENNSPTPEDIEARFDGHICRCTGFRAILNAMQSFHGDKEAIEKAVQVPTPIDHLSRPRSLHFSGSGQDYYKVTSLKEALGILRQHKVSPNDVKLLNGNTSVGIYKKDVYFPKTLIDISQVSELFEKEIRKDGIHLGGGRAMQDLLELTEMALNMPEHSSDAGLIALNKHVHRIAGTQVRSVASVAGNIMLVKNHEFEGEPFPSDLFTCLVTLNGEITLVTPESKAPKTFKALEMPPVDSFNHGFIIKKIFIPFTRKNRFIQTFKISRRYQNAHAVINAGFNCEVNGDTIKNAVIVYGGVARIAMRASETERFLNGKKWTKPTFNAALDILKKEIKSSMISMSDEGISEAYRQSLAIGLFHKYGIYLADCINPDIIKPEDRSGGYTYNRPVSKGNQGYILAPYNDGQALKSRSFASSRLAFNATSAKTAAPSFVNFRNVHAEALDLAPVQKNFLDTKSVHFQKTKKGEGRTKLSAFIQASGEAKYTQDLSGPPNTLHATFVYSQAQFATFSYKFGKDELEQKLKEQFPNAVRYITVDDIPLAGKQSHFFKNNNIFDKDNPEYVWANYDPVFANQYVTAYGQAIGVVVAKDLYTSRDGAAWLMQQIEYQHIEEGKATTVEEALKLPINQGQLPYPTTKIGLSKMIRPNSDANWINNPGPVDGKVYASGRQLTGAQYHFYMETQATLAIPTENNTMHLFSSTQHLASVQQQVAAILGLQNNKVEAEVIRLGGGFGGKEVRPPYPAMAASIAAWVLKQPVRLANDRNTDMTMQGTRHSFRGDYHVVANQDGIIEKIKLDYLSNAGHSFDCSQPVMDLVLLSADNAYNIPTFAATGISCRTNIASRTAFRSFGVIQCSLVAEEAMEHIAYNLGIRPETVRERNFYKDATATQYDYTPYGQALKYCRMKQVWDDLKTASHFEARLAEVETFNKNNRWRKRGISLIPLKYGISYTYRPMNQGGAYVVVYSTDGTVTIEHGGIEMGQGIHTKIAEIAASILEIDINLIRIGTSDTMTVPNASSTGASTGTDLNGGAVKMACLEIKKRLSSFCQANPDNPALKDWKSNWTKMWPAIVAQAYDARINLSAQALYASPKLGDLTEEPPTSGNWVLKGGDQAFYYFNYCAAVSEVEIDVLTGESTILRSDLVYDAGKSVNPVIDFGQIEGGFIQGVGNVTTEEIYYAKDGKLIPNGTWNYKPPATKCIPVEFNVYLLNYVKNNHMSDTPMDFYGIQSSKSTGEPPLVLANTVFFAIKRAILSAREDAGVKGWFELESPATVEKIQLACLSHLPRTEKED